MWASDRRLFLVAISRMLEARYDFSQVENELKEHDRTAVQLWQTNTQKEELEFVAKSIRQRLHDGARYRDIRVLLGDVEAYQLQLKTIFDQYQIPFYLGRSEAMVHHPLIQVIESLGRIKQFNYQTEDVINLLKTGLYSDLTQEEVDAFEQYLRFAEVKGATKFYKPFTSNRQGKFNFGRAQYSPRTRRRTSSPLLFTAQTKGDPSLNRLYRVSARGSTFSESTSFDQGSSLGGAGAL